MEDYREIYKVGGCLPQPKDKRDWKITELMPLRAIELPREYCSDIPYEWIYDQGSSSECCACAYSLIRAMQEREQSNLDERFAPSFTYANRNREDDYEGMMLRKCCSKGREGSVLWSDFPNFYSYRRAREIFDHRRISLLNKARPFRISSFYTAHTNEEMKMAIYLTKAVLIGINVTKEFYYPDKNGVIHYNDPNGEELGGHAIVVGGWRYIDNKPYWIIINSWGRKWGDNGCCYISFDDLSRYLMDDAYVLVDDVNEIKISEYREKYLSANKFAKVKYEIKNLWNLLYRKLIRP